MDRREVFQIALQSGALLTLTRRESALAATDATPKVEFQTCRLRGGKFEGWEAILA